MSFKEFTRLIVDQFSFRSFLKGLMVIRLNRFKRAPDTWTTREYRKHFLNTYILLYLRSLVFYNVLKQYCLITTRVQSYNPLTTIYPLNLIIKGNLYNTVGKLP